MVSKEEALRVLRQCEEAGLVHKAYHTGANIEKEETSICNCCRCCCVNGKDSCIVPTTTATYFVARVNKELCVGCGTCVEKCPNDAVVMGDDKNPLRIEGTCMGCGVCAYFCPENAIELVQSPGVARILPVRRS